MTRKTVEQRRRMAEHVLNLSSSTTVGACPVCGKEADYRTHGSAFSVYFRLVATCRDKDCKGARGVENFDIHINDFRAIGGRVK